MLITSRKFYSKYYNSDDFSTDLSDFNENLAGSRMETKKVVFEVELAIKSKAKTNLPFTLDSTDKSLLRSVGNFLEDGFRIGDTATLFWNGLTSSVKIIGIDKTELILEKTSGDAFTDYSGADVVLTCTSDLPAFELRYGIVENKANAEYKSFIDGTNQGWYVEGMTDGGSAVDGKPLGESINKSWINGAMTCQWLSKTNGVYTYEATHEFIIPYFEDGEYSNLEDKEVPDDYESFKYVADFQFSRTLTNPNSSRGLQEINILGAVGWYQEPYNGLNMPFSVSNLVYEDGSANVISRIVSGIDTVVKFTINSTSASFSGTTNTGCLVSKLPTITQYQNKTNNFNDNWLNDSIYEVCGTAFTGGTNEIKEYEATFVDANTITVEMLVNFPDVEAIDKYLIAFEIASDGGTNVLSDKTMLIVATNTFEKSADVPSLMTLDEMYFELYPDTVGDNDFTNIYGWVEDDLNCNFKFTLDTSLGAYLEKLEAKIVAFNTTDETWFELENINFPLQSEIITTDGQVFNLNTERGFNRTKGGYNILKLNNLASTPPNQEYEGQVSLKIDWQEWLKLDNADTVFYDNTKENYGLNENASNYSLKEGYEIRILLDADVSNGDVSTNYVFSSPQNRIYNYDLDDNGTPIWSGEIKTYDENGTELGQGILSEGTTTIKAIFTPSSGTWANEKVFISLEPINAPSKNQIVKYDATVSYDALDVVGEIDINRNDLINGVRYKISARLRAEPDTCLPNVTDVTVSYPTPKSGLFTILLNMWENDGTTPLATGVVKITFDDNGTDLYEATFNIGDNISSATPLTDTGTEPFADLQAYFTSAVIGNGNSFIFDKLNWAIDEGRVDDGSGSTEAQFTVKLETTSPCSSNVGSDTIDNKTWFEYRACVIGMQPGTPRIAAGTITAGTLGSGLTYTDYYNSSSAIYLNPTGAVFNGANTVSGAHPGVDTFIAAAPIEVQIGQMTVTSEGNCLNTRQVNNSVGIVYYVTSATWDEAQTMTFTRAGNNSIGFTVTNETFKVISGGSLAVPTNAVPLAPRVTGGTTESTDSYGTVQTSLVIDIPAPAGYGVFHLEGVITANSGGTPKEAQDIILVKLIKY